MRRQSHLKLLVVSADVAPNHAQNRHLTIPSRLNAVREGDAYCVNYVAVARVSRAVLLTTTIRDEPS
jgi:hypothetical protein